MRVRPDNAKRELVFDRVLADSEGGTIRLYLTGYAAADVYKQHALRLAVDRGLSVGPATIFPPEVIAIHVQSRDQLEQAGSALDEIVGRGYGRFWELSDPDLQQAEDADQDPNAEPWQLVHPPPDPREIFVVER